MLYKWKLINNSFERVCDVRYGMQQQQQEEYNEHTIRSLGWIWKANWNSKSLNFMYVLLDEKLHEEKQEKNQATY